MISAFGNTITLTSEPLMALTVPDGGATDLVVIDVRRMREVESPLPSSVSILAACRRLRARSLALIADPDDELAASLAGAQANAWGAEPVRRPWRCMRTDGDRPRFETSTITLVAPRGDSPRDLLDPAEPSAGSVFRPLCSYAGVSVEPRSGGAGSPAVVPGDLWRWIIRVCTPNDKKERRVVIGWAGTNTAAWACVVEGVRAIVSFGSDNAEAGEALAFAMDAVETRTIRGVEGRIDLRNPLIREREGR